MSNIVVTISPKQPVNVEINQRQPIFVDMKGGAFTRINFTLDNDDSEGAPFWTPGYGVSGGTVNLSLPFATSNIDGILSKFDYQSFAAKASTAYVDAVEAALSAQIDLKADLTYVNSSLALKANISYVDSADSALAIQISTKVSKSGDSMTGYLLFADGYGIDTTAAGGALNIATLYATTANIATGNGVQTVNVGTGTGVTYINIGGPGDVVSIAGDRVIVGAMDHFVKDKRITLNRDGLANSAFSAGFEFEEGGLITGYVTTTGGRDGFAFKAPAWPYDMSFSGTFTAARTFTLPDNSGTLVTRTSEFYATTTADGLVSTTAQTFAGDKVFARIGLGDGITTATVGNALHIRATAFAQANALIERAGNTAAIRFARFNTNFTAPTAILLNNEIWRLEGYAYDTTATPNPASVEVTRINATARVNWTATDRSTGMSFDAIAPGTISRKSFFGYNLDNTDSIRLNAASVLVGGTTNFASSALTVDSTVRGVLIPRMTSAQRTAIPSPANGLLVMQTDGGAGVEGLYRYQTSTVSWVRIG